MKPDLTPDAVHHKIKQRYTEISCSLQNRFKYPVGGEGARVLGYDLQNISHIPHEAVDAFCGVGNPFGLGPVRAGDHVLDVGCGAGLDLLLAGQACGSHGHARGIDLVPAIAEKARKNIKKTGVNNVTVELAGSEALPFKDSTFDIVISNGAIYLSPLKLTTFREMCRVLKPGGRMQVADVVLKEDLPEKVLTLFDGWSG